MSESQLRQMMGYAEGTELRADAETELERRKFWKNFLSHGIPSWLALIVSVFALFISAYVAFFSHRG